MSLVAFLMLVAGEPVTSAERDMIAYCRSVGVIDGGTRSGATRIHEGRGVCFSGEIDDAAAQQFGAALARLGGSPIIVVDTGGGEVDAGLDMADAIAARQATVIVDGICASSCANYLLPASSRRVISTNGVLAFHGGAVDIPADALRTLLKPIAPPDQLDEVVASVRQENAARLARQSRFETSVGMRGFFRWMADLDALPPAEKHRICADENATSLVFSDARLQERGLVLHVNNGPKSGPELSYALAENGVEWTACYVP